MIQLDHEFPVPITGIEGLAQDVDRLISAVWEDFEAWITSKLIEGVRPLRWAGGCWLLLLPKHFELQAHQSLSATPSPGVDYFKLPGTTLHRVVYERYRGPAPGLELHHSCRVKGCLHPWHMVALTRQEHEAVHKAIWRWFDPSPDGRERSREERDLQRSLTVFREPL